VWECSKLTACERFLNGMGSLVPSHLQLRAGLEDVFSSAIQTGLKAQDMVLLWKPIVAAFSASQLTRDPDRLVALHGVAVKIKQVLGCQYAAGLFSRDIESQLL